jgi:hypothetical protein
MLCSPATDKTVKQTMKNAGDKVLHTYKITDKIVVLFILIFIFLDDEWVGRRMILS